MVNFSLGTDTGDLLELMLASPAVASHIFRKGTVK